MRRQRVVHCVALSIVITLLWVNPLHLRAQQLTSYAPPANPPVFGPKPSPAAGQQASQPDYPDAIPVPAAKTGAPVTFESDTQSERDKIFTLDGDAVVTYQDRILRADHLAYDANTGDVTATGHLVVTGGTNGERIEASHGTLNLKSETGRFFDVHGSVGLMPTRAGTPAKVFSNGAPFLFAGRMVVKTGPKSYDIYKGSVTSCELKNPDWILTAAHFSVVNDTARASGSVFRLLNIPVLYLPYVTHATDPEERQSGFMIPTLGQSSTKGFIIGEQIYLVLNRSMDLTIGAEYYSERGFAQDATFRYKGAGLNFVKFHYSGLLDRLKGNANQGGEDAILSMRHDFTPRTRMAADVEYLSSYIYRQAFTDNFNQAVNSDILSTAYVTHHRNGFELTGLADRYQGIKVVAAATQAQQQVTIFHVPTVSIDSTEHRFRGTGLELSVESSVSGLKRTQPNFVTGGVVERIDIHPQAAFPFGTGGWRFRPSVAFRETAYSRSLRSTVLSDQPQQSLAAVSRSDIEVAFGVRAPVLERTFAPNRWHGLLGDSLRHTLEPELNYKLIKGVSNFKDVLRFDATDIVSNTNELEYGLTQRVFRKRSMPCTSAASSLPDAPAVSSTMDIEGGLNPDPTLAAASAGTPLAAAAGGCSDDELISWSLTQKYFFDPRFGGAIVNGRRNILDTTLSLSGVAFLTEPREISPLISRLRMRTSAHTDIEWDFDLDTGSRRFTSSNLFLDLHATDGAFAALSYARLDAPGRFFTEGVSPTNGVTTAVSDFNQLRFLIGYGSPTKPGLSLAANTGLDLKSLYGATSTVTAPSGVQTSTTVYPALLQYATLQGNYNFNCCGFSVEYRKFELGSVRNEGSYRFNFTLANIGTAGNLRRSERLF